MLSLVIATRNAHKTREFAEILGSAFHVSDLRDFPDLPLVEETGRTFEENAILKATAASRAGSGMVVADDSGLEVDALNGAPGIYSARYAGQNATDEENIKKLLTEMEPFEGTERRARFRCVLAIAQAGAVRRILEGNCYGFVRTSPRGRNGFGYDPLFVPDKFTRTFAELGSAEKNRISHRAAAIDQLRQFLSAFDSPLIG